MTRAFVSAGLIACAVVLLPAAVRSQPQKRPVPVVEPITAEGLKELARRDSGKVVLINAWATWCAPCKTELPILLRLRREFGAKGLSLVLVSTDEPEDLDGKLVPLLDSLGVDFVSYIGRDSSQEAFINGLNPRWGGAIPATFVFDRSGRQTRMLVGGRTYEQFRTVLLPLLRTSP